MREYRHPEIDHTFIIKDISPFEISIDSIRVHRSECDWMVRTANHCQTRETKTMNDLALPFLQSILMYKEKNK